LGIHFSERGRPSRQQSRQLQERDLFFDPAKRILTLYKAGEWKLSEPEPKGWDVEVIVPGAAPLDRTAHTVFSVKLQGSQKHAITTAAGKRLDQYPLLPPFQGLDAALLAVAYRENGQAFLSLFDCGTGKEIREYTGHRDRITSLAFSADGKLLLSASED